MLRIGVLRLFCQNKEGNNKSHCPLYGVEKVSTLEPYDNEILSQIMQSDNIYHRLILLMKLDTQTYYNIRMILRLEYNQLFNISDSNFANLSLSLFCLILPSSVKPLEFNLVFFTNFVLSKFSVINFI